MNMSEDVTAVSMQVSEKAAEAALSAFKSVLDSVGRLFRELLGMEHGPPFRVQFFPCQRHGSAPSGRPCLFRIETYRLVKSA